MTIITCEFDYQKDTITHPTYQYSKINQQSGLQTITVPTGGGVESIFELPPKVFNLARSILTNVVVPGTGAANNLVFLDCIPHIQQIQLYSRTGMYLCDLMYANNYTSAIMRHENLLGEVLNNDIPGDDVGFWEGLFPCNEAVTANVFPPTGAASDVNYIEPAYQCLTAGYANAHPIIHYQFQLRQYKNTILSLDKDLYFGGETLYLRVVWAPSAKLGYLVTPATMTAAYTITNLVLLLAVEQNKILENQLMEKVKSGEGFTTICPMVYYNKINLGASSNQSIQVRYNRGHGATLKKIYVAPFANVENSNTAYSRNNAAGAMVSIFNTTVNNTRTSQYDYYCANGDDWIAKKDKLKGSCILTSNEYYRNWTWIEDFTDNYSLQDRKYILPQSVDNILDGLNLNEEVIYQFTNYNTVGNNPQLNYYVFACTQKNLVVNANGIQLV